MTLKSSSLSPLPVILLDAALRERIISDKPSIGCIGLGLDNKILAGFIIYMLTYLLSLFRYSTEMLN